MKDIDVVIPCWGNYTKYLDKAIESVARDANVVVVGDNSAAISARRHGVAFLEVAASELSVGSARNIGQRWGSAEYICFLDADDVIHPGGLNFMRQELQRSRSCVAVSCVLHRVGGHGRWPPRWFAHLICSPGGGPLLLFRNGLSLVGACLIRRSALNENIALFPNLEDEDWHAALTIRALGPVRFLNVELVDYNVRNNSRSRRPRDIQDLQRSRAELIDAVVKAQPRGMIVWQLTDFLAGAYRAYRVRKLQARQIRNREGLHRT